MMFLFWKYAKLNIFLICMCKSKMINKMIPSEFSFCSQENIVPLRMNILENNKQNNEILRW